MKQTFEERFWAKVHKTKTCWLWTAYIDADGYGRVRPPTGSEFNTYAHCVSYVLLVGPIPPGLKIDHVKANGCVNRHCINPSHLEPVTPRENMLRSAHPSAVAFNTNTCFKGHSLDDAYINGTGGRQCRTCKLQYSREYRERHRP